MNQTANARPEMPQATHEQEPPYRVIGSLGYGMSGPHSALSASLGKFPNRAWRRNQRKQAN